MINKFKCLPPLLVSLTTLFAFSGHAKDIDLTSSDFEMAGQVHEVVTYKGHQALKLKNAVVKNMGVEFSNGTIEFDMATPHDRGFSGIRFHVGSGDQGGTMEEFYIRPHQRGKPDSTQYTPVFHGAAGWQLYHGPQFSSDDTLEADIWHHYKIVVSGTRADIYINDMDNVALAIPELKSGIESGGIQLFSNSIPAYFSNLSITHGPSPELTGKPVPLPETPDTRVKEWRISASFPDTDLEDNGVLAIDLNDIKWTPLAAEENGITNIARIARISRETNTALAGITIASDKAALLRVKFGYSDQVRVYLNGDEVYRGTNGFRTRDFRYLGTIGLFDEIPLRLKKGNNELIFAVTEAFGGWGIMADIAPKDGITVSAK